MASLGFEKRKIMMDKKLIDRRECAKAVLAVGVGALACNQVAFAGVGLAGKTMNAAESNYRLGLAAYSFRDHFEFKKGKTQKPIDGKAMDMFGFIDYCAAEKCGAELTSYFFPPDADADYFLSVKRHAFKKGVPIVGTAIGNNFTIDKGPKLDQQIVDAKKWIDNAVLMGAPHIRFFAGTRSQLEKNETVIETAIESLQECVDYAAQRGVFVGVENHGKLTVEQVLKIKQGIKSDWFGINLDTGNFISDDPYADLEKCAPFAVNIQVKLQMKNPQGETYDADFDRLAKIVGDADFCGFVVLEYEETDPMKNVPAAMKKLRAAFG